MSAIGETPAEPVDRLVEELLATGLLGESDIADLHAYRADWQAGRLHPDDLAYLKAFHARLLDPDRVVDVENEIEPAGPDWRARAEVAEAEVARLRALLAEHGIADPAGPGPVAAIAPEPSAPAS